MQIGLLTTSYPRFAGDVAGSFVREFAEAMRSLGHQVDVLAPADDQERAEYDAAHLRYLPRSLRRTFYESGVPDNIRHPRAWPGLAAFPIALLREASMRPWDALVSHFGVPCALVGSLIARGRPHLAVWHSADVTLANSLSPLRALAPHLATKHWCVTEGARDSLRLDGAIVSPMGAHPPNAERDESRRRLGIERDEVVVSFVGRLVPIKGLRTLFAAAAGLPLRLLIAGEGPERSYLESLKNVNATFLGHVDRPGRDAVLMASDAFAMPSRAVGNRQEGAPCALLEAQLAALPILASRSGGLAERVEHGVDGLLIRPDDTHAWRDSLRCLLRGELAGMGASAAKANGHLTWQALAPTIESALTF
ncbi:MAG: glycosyltransferase involved in cell wall biosynthesis [Polyangiales bacterium]|jgi:glycosyltransferase involved in cell wall biosynthesis